jgi:hypothetical protein
MKYRIKYFGSTRYLSTMINETEVLALTLYGLLNTVAAYKASANK